MAEVEAGKIVIDSEVTNDGAITDLKGIGRMIESLKSSISSFGTSIRSVFQRFTGTAGQVARETREINNALKDTESAANKAMSAVSDEKSIRAWEELNKKIKNQQELVDGLRAKKAELSSSIDPGLNLDSMKAEAETIKQTIAKYQSNLDDARDKYPKVSGAIAHSLGNVIQTMPGKIQGKINELTELEDKIKSLEFKSADIISVDDNLKEAEAELDRLLQQKDEFKIGNIDAEGAIDSIRDVEEQVQHTREEAEKPIEVNIDQNGAVEPVENIVPDAVGESLDDISDKAQSASDKIQGLADSEKDLADAATGGNAAENIEKVSDAVENLHDKASEPVDSNVNVDDSATDKIEQQTEAIKERNEALSQSANAPKGDNKPIVNKDDLDGVRTLSDGFSDVASAAQMSLKDITAAIGTMQQSVAQLDKNLRSSVSGYASAMKSNATASHDFYQELRTLEAQAERLRAAIAADGGNHESAAFIINAKEIAEAQKALSEVEAEMNNLNSQKRAIQTPEFQQMEKEADGLRKYIESLKSQYNSLWDNVKAKGSMNGAEYNESGRLEKEVQGATERLNDLEAKMQPAQAKISELDAGVSKYAEKLENARNKLAELQRERDEMLSNGKAYDDSAVIENKKALADLEQQIERIKGALAKTPEAKSHIADSLKEDAKKALALLEEYRNKRDEYMAAQDEIGERAFGSRRAYQRNAVEIDRGEPGAVQERDVALANIGATDEWNKAADGVQEYMTNIDLLKAKIAGMIDQMTQIRSVSIGDIDTSSIDAVNTAIEQTKANLRELRGTRELLRGSNAEEDVEHMQQLNAAIEETKETLRQLYEEEQRQIDAGNAPTERYAQMAEQLEDAEVRLSDLRSKEEELKSQGADEYGEKWQNYTTWLQSAEDELNSLKAKQQEALNAGDTSGASGLQGAIDAAEQRVESFKGKLQEMSQSGDDKLAQQWIKLQADIEKTRNDVERYERAVGKLEGMGEGGTEEWENLQTQIDDTTDELNDYESQMQEMRADGGEGLANAYVGNEDAIDRERQKLEELLAVRDRLQEQPASDVGGGSFSFLSKYMDVYMRKWQQMTTLSGMVGNTLAAAFTPIVHPIQAADRALGALIVNVRNAVASLARMAGNAALSFLRSLADGARNAAIQLARLASNAVQGALARLNSLARGVGRGLSSIGAVAAGAGKRILGLSKNVRHANGGFKASLKTILKYAFGVRSMFFLFRRLRKAVTEGLGEVAKQNPALQKALNALSQSFNALKGSLAVAFAPIVTVVAPILVKLMDLLTGVINKLGEFFAALTGQTTYVASVKKAASSISDAASSAAKGTGELNNQLASFDSLNVLDKGNSGSDSIDALGSSADKSSKKVKDLKRQLAGFDSLNILNANNSSSTSDSDFNYKTLKIGQGMLDFVKKIKELFAAGDFEGIGKLFADKINGIFEWLDNAISWENIGDKITKFIDAITGIFNGLLHNIKWTKIGRTIGSGINTIVNALNQLLEKIDWNAIGTAIALGLNGLIGRVDWAALGKLFANRLNAFADVLRGFVDNFKFGPAGKKFAQAITSFVTSVKWKELGENLAKLIGGAMDFIYEAITNADWPAMINSFVEGFNTFVDELRKKFNEFKGKATEIGRTFGEAVNTLFTAVDWEDIGGVLADGIDLALKSLVGTVTTIKWGDAGAKFAQAVNGFFKNEDLWKDAGTIIDTAIKGLLDFRKNFVITFNAEEAGNRIREALERIDFKGIAGSFWDLVKTTFEKAGSFINAILGGSQKKFDPGTRATGAFIGTSKTLAQSLADALNKAISDIPWGTIASTAGQLLTDALDFVKSFIDKLNWTEFGSKVQDAFTSVPWATIASKTWSLIKSAFSATGNFLDALFSEKVDWTRAQIDPAYLEKVTAFNGKSLGEKIGARVSEAISSIKWGDFAETLSNAVKSLFDNVKGFFMALGEVDESGTSKLQQSLTEFFAKIDWWGIAKSIITAAWEAFKSIGTALVNAILEPFIGPVGDAMIEKSTALEDGITGAVNKAFGLAGNDAKTKSAVANYASMLMNQFGYDLDAAVREGMKKFDVGEEYADEFIQDYIERFNINVPEAASATQGAVDQVGAAGIANASQNGALTTDAYWSSFQASINDNSNASDAFKTAMDYVLAAGDFSANGQTTAEDFYNGFTAMIVENGKVKDEYKAAIEEIFGAGAADAFENGGMTIDKFYNGLTTNAVDGEGNVSASLQTIMDGIYTSIDGGGYGNATMEAYYKAFQDEIKAEGGGCKAEYKSWLESVYGPGKADALADGKMTMQEFINGWNKGARDNESEAKTTVVGVFTGVVGAIKDKLGIASPSTVAAGMAKFFLEGFAEGAEQNQSTAQSRVSKVFEGISKAVSGVVSGVKGFFSNLFGGKKQDANTGVSADDIAKPYEDGAARGQTALKGLSATTTTETANIKTAFDGVGNAIATAMEGAKNALSGLGLVTSTEIGAVREALSGLGSDAAVAAVGMTSALKDLDSSTSTATKNMKSDIDDLGKATKSVFSDIKQDSVSQLGAMNTDTQTQLGLVKDTFRTALDLVKQNASNAFMDVKTNATTTTGLMNIELGTNLTNINGTFINGLSSVNNTVSQAFQTLHNTVSSKMQESAQSVVSNMLSANSNIISPMSALNSTISNGFNSIRNSMVNSMVNAFSVIQNQDWYNLGGSIVTGIGRGFSNVWNRLRDQVVQATNNLLASAKRALGIHSPSTVFRDEIGKNMGLGLVEGWQDTEPNMIKAISSIAEVASDEMEDAKITTTIGIGENNLVYGLDDVLTTFADKVTNSFANLVEKLAEISSAVTLYEPAISTGAVMPYSVAASNQATPQGASTASTGLNDETLNVLMQLVNNQTSAIVQAIQQYSGTTVAIDKRSLTDTIINEINRRTRAQGKSPLLI